MNDEIKLILKNQEIIMRTLFNTPLSHKMNRLLGIQITKTIDLLNPEEKESLQEKTKDTLRDK